MQVTIDTRLRLLAGYPIEVENFGQIKPLLVKDIVEKGYTKYMQMLHIFTLQKEHLLKDPPEDITVFDILLRVSTEDVLELFRESLAFFMQDKVTMLRENNVIAIGEGNNLKVINRDNFEAICKIIQIQNCILSDEEERVISNEKAKAVTERMKQTREQVKKAKQKEGNGEDESDFFDLVSAISSKSNSINKFNVFDLTIFQVYEEFKRLNAIESYSVNLDAMMQGAKNVKLVHWSQKLKI